MLNGNQPASRICCSMF